ncbi:aldehyde dehydrogenase family protein [Paracoccus siganidrum]|uniref:aldehyde dehydrogenase (NAD(+)) n=1 Tax=Paracoccus siganidrum TaxID=1276757 RepID=A0A419ABD4_9RHOB|nr:aldehyde dehydrogenase family protein [Paracoccus siganidrum]RJL20764.1 aldehyde dehydrogenase family protein [Paracoccus siganidrum]RMC31926.1 aldehyde dehydrogenase [Paracoccus siganidrum]
MPNESCADLLNRPAWLFIDGDWQTGQGEAIGSIDPGTGQELVRLAGARPQDVAPAAAAAARAFDGWRRQASTLRAGFLRGFAAGLRRRADALVALQMLNNGKPRFEAQIDLDDAAATFDYYAGLAEAFDARQDGAVEMPDGLSGRTRFEALGPMALIVPWNFPLVTTAWKLAPALAAGCTAVLKPSEVTTPAELVYADIAAEIGLPAGVLNILPGAGPVGAALCADPTFRKISFTGANATGRRVMAAAAERCTPVALELGGKSPIVILKDADVAQAVEIAAAGIFFNAGQMCSATSRLIVDAGIADAVIDGLRRHVADMVVAGPDDPDAVMGPLTTAAQRDKVLGYLLTARRDGLDCLAGGAAAAGPGFFVEPTIYLDVQTDHPVWREEIFGPVLAIRRAAGLDEALALANDSDFGLAATVVGGQDAQNVANRIDAGHVWINNAQIIPPGTAWGGFRQSGIGRELGPWGLAACCGVKHVTTAAAN